MLCLPRDRLRNARRFSAAVLAGILPLVGPGAVAQALQNWFAHRPTGASLPGEAMRVRARPCSEGGVPVDVTGAQDLPPEILRLIAEAAPTSSAAARQARGASPAPVPDGAD